MKLSRIIASLKKALGLDPAENKRKFINNYIATEKLKLANNIMTCDSKINQYLTDFAKDEIKDLHYTIDNLFSKFESKENYERELKRWEKVEKYLNEEIEIETTEPKKEEKKK